MSPLLRRAPILLILLGFLAVAGSGSLSAQEEPDPAPLQPAEAEELLPLLQQNYDNPGALKGLHTAADLPSLLPALHGVSLRKGTPLDPRSFPIRTEILPGEPSLGYWRLGSFVPPHGWTALETELDGWNTANRAGVDGLIIDLRHCASIDDFDGAARIASFFLPDNTVLFSIQSLHLPQKVYQTGGTNDGSNATSPSPTQARLPFNRPLVVLIDRETRGAAEVLADLLRRRAAAVLIGRSTPGEAALFVETRLQSGRTARIAAAPVLLPDGTPLFGTPVTPDIAVHIDDKTENEVLAQLQLGSAALGLVEAALRHRMNEASLVNNENPEIDEALAEQAREAKKDGPPAPLQDLTLMRGVDVLKGIVLFPTSDMGATVSNAPSAPVESGATAVSP